MPLSYPEVGPRLLDELVGYYYEAYPREAVGVVMTDGSVVPFKNRSVVPHRFYTTGFPLLQQFGWQAWRHGDGVAYFFHSHRQTTRPSETDKTFMGVLASRWPHVKHLIFTPSREYSIWAVK